MTKSFKILAWIVLILMNLFFVYFCLLRAMMREHNWQRGYVIACILQLFIEVLWYETVECVWVNYGIPRLVTDEVETILLNIRETIDEVFDVETNSPSVFPPSSSTSTLTTTPLLPSSLAIEPCYCLDAPSYLFVSTNLAEIFPKPFESTVVSSYHSIFPSPGGYVHNFRDAKKLEKSRNIKESGSWGILKRIGVVSLMTIILQTIGTFHIRAQKLILHTIQPIIIGFLLVAWEEISSSLTLSLFVLLMMGLMIAILIRWLFSKRQSIIKKKEAEEENKPRKKHKSISTNDSSEDIQNRSQQTFPPLLLNEQVKSMLENKEVLDVSDHHQSTSCKDEIPTQAPLVDVDPVLVSIDQQSDNASFSFDDSEGCYESEDGSVSSSDMSIFSFENILHSDEISSSK